ncbi:hypothetical protein E2C01_090202 [Portunus trituberculatus]|uniref:Uncharacterized protein n=1 Tax=Portunus trituberculatus TaxID=210409 RepID=A0A5B7JE24_PORTR|nr:hypothetical protein [Portunus trituberculatus]
MPDYQGGIKGCQATKGRPKDDKSPRGEQRMLLWREQKMTVIVWLLWGKGIKDDRLLKGASKDACDRLATKGVGRTRHGSDPQG